MKKTLFVLILLCVISFGKISTVSAIRAVPEDYSYSCYLSVNGDTAVSFSLDGIIRKGSIMQLSINGNPALCVNYNLKLGVSYELVDLLYGIDQGGQFTTYAPLYKIYNYVKSHPGDATAYKYGQIALWSMLSANKANWSIRFTKTYSSVIQLRQNFPDFYDSFSRGYSCNSSTGRQRLKSNSDYPNWMTGQTNSQKYDCKIFEMSKEEYCKSQKPEVSSIKKADELDAACRSYYNYYQKVIETYGKQNDKYLSIGISSSAAGVPSEVPPSAVDSSQGTGISDETILSIYNAIASQDGHVPWGAAGSLGVWCPVAADDDGAGDTFSKVQGGQCVLAPVEIKCATCNSALEKYKEGRSKYTLQELKKMFPRLNIDDPNNPYCENQHDECVKISTMVKRYPKAFNSSVLSKYSSRVQKYGYKVSYSRETIACGGDYCNTLLPKLNSGQMTLEEFNAKRKDSSYVKVEKHPDGLYYCKPTGSTPKTCKELLPSYPGVQSDSAFDTFVNSITDPEKAVHNGDGTISCNPCKPVVDTARAICDVQGKQPSGFELKDAAATDGTPNEACYKKGTSYQIEGEKLIPSKDDNFSKSPYCDVYCWESVYVSLPSDPSFWGTITAGSIYYWGLDYSQHIFATLETKRICWTKPDYVAFTTAWNANETAISQAYADYMAEVEYNKQGDSDVTVDSNKCCPGDYTAATEGKYTKVNDCPVNDVACASANGCGVNDCDTSQGYWGRKSGGEEEKCSVAWGKTYKLPSKDYTIPGTTIKGTSNSKTSGCTSGSVSADDLKDTDEETKRKAAVAEKVGKRNTLREQLLACQSKSAINESNMYDYSKASIKFKPDFTTKLNLSTYGVVNEDLEGTITKAEVATQSVKGAIDKTFNCSGINGGIGDSDNICNGQAYISVDNYEDDGYVWNYSGIYAFKYKDDFFFLSKKTTSELTNDLEGNSIRPDGYEKNKNLYYIEGYGLPVAFTTSEGYFLASVEISGLGNKGHFDDILNQDDAEEKYGYNFKDGYSCPYYVYNPLYQHQCHYECDADTMKCKKTADSPVDCCDPQITTCDKGKLAIVYRLIDMGEGKQKRIFPSIDGDGRKICSGLSDTNCIGANWAEFIDKKGGTPFKNITTTKVIYDNTPMYTIELTPTNIGKIRKDNTELRESGKDPYTSYRDAKNKLKITCDEYQDETKSCVSSYITTLMNGNYKVITGGSFKIANESQRLKALRSYKTCYDNSNPSC